MVREGHGRCRLRAPPGGKSFATALRMEQTKNKPLSSHWLQGKAVH